MAVRDVKAVVPNNIVLRLGRKALTTSGRKNLSFKVETARDSDPGKIRVSCPGSDCGPPIYFADFIIEKRLFAAALAFFDSPQRGWRLQQSGVVLTPGVEDFRGSTVEVTDDGGALGFIYTVSSSRESWTEQLLSGGKLIATVTGRLPGDTVQPLWVLNLLKQGYSET
ncbi:MAG: hypothetical protein NT099_01540 [Candidatus Saganbacteria bacterium]|nr:hypothetical protein [Candidatus Saganbacteria bacterium]